MQRTLLRGTKVTAGALTVALASGAFLVGTAGTADAAERTVITNGTHVDSLYPELDGGQLVVKSHLDSGEVDPDSIDHFVPDTQKSDIPQKYADALGLDTTSVWVGSQSGGDDGPYAGWSTYGLEDAVGSKSVDFTLTGTEGPGQVAVFQTGSFGDVVPKFARDANVTTVTESARAHVHANWAFTAPGTYNLDFDVTARLKNGETKVASTTLHWTVGGDSAGGTEPPAQSDQTLTLSGYKDRYTIGEQAELRVIPSEGWKPDHYHWLGKAAGVAEYGELDSISDVYSFVVGPEMDGMQVKALSHGSAGDVETKPVTLHVVAADGGDEDAEVTLAASTTQKTWLIGQSVKITAVASPVSSATTYKWFIQRDGESKPSEVWGQKTANFSAKPELDWDGAKFFARLYDSKGAQVAQSNDVTFAVEQVPAQGTIAAKADKGTYTVGDTAHFSAELTPLDGAEVEEGHPHWYVQKVGEGAYTFVPESKTFVQDLVLDASYNGAKVKTAYFRGTDHAQIAASNVITLSVVAATEPGDNETPAPGDGETPAPGDGETPKPGDGETPATPIKPTESFGPLSDAEIAAADRGEVQAPDYAVAPGATIELKLGATRAGTWNQVWLHSDPVDLGWALADADGTITVTVPSNAPAGAHRLVVLANDGSVVGWDDLTVLAVAGDAAAETPAGDPTAAAATAGDTSGATGELAFTGAELTPAAVGALLLLATGLGVMLVIRRRRAADDEQA